MSKAIGLIGTDLTVTAENLDVVLGVFPELAHNAETAADGTLKINQAVYDDTMAKTAAEISLDAAATEEYIDN